MGSRGIRDRVAIVGMGCTEFGEHWDRSTESMLIDSTSEAVASAGISSGSARATTDAEGRFALMLPAGQAQLDVTATGFTPQRVSVAITAGMRVDELALVPLSFPTYAGILGRVAASVTRQLNRQDFWQTN